MHRDVLVARLQIEAFIKKMKKKYDVNDNEMETILKNQIKKLDLEK
jgi:hypothetical protein